MKALPKIILVGTLTGVGYLLSLIMVPIMTRSISSEIIADIGVIENLLAIYISMATFGIQMSLSREIVSAKKWRPILQRGRGERLTVSLFFTFIVNMIAIVFNSENKNLIMITSFALPLIALNADFALYARSKPIAAAIISLIRQSVPLFIFIILILNSSDNDNYQYIYAGLVLIFIFISGYFSTRFLNINYLSKLNFDFLSKKKEYALIGLSALLLSILRAFPVLIANTFFSKENVLAIYGVMKIFIVFVGVRRLLTQTFFKEIATNKDSSRIESILITGTSLFLVLLFFYNGEFTSLVYGESSDKISNIYMMLLGLACLGSSIFFTSGTVLVQQKKDKEYFINHLIAFLTVSVAILIIYIEKLPAYSLIITLFISESTLNVAHKVSISK